MIFTPTGWHLASAPGLGRGSMRRSTALGAAISLVVPCAFAQANDAGAALQTNAVPVAEARIESLTPAQAEQERLRALIDAAPKVYEDSYFSPADAARVAADNPQSGDRAEGHRAWLLESRVGFNESSGTGFGTRRATEFGVRAEYRRETLNYGQFILQADGRHLSGDRVNTGFGFGAFGYAATRTSGRFLVRNIGLPISGTRFVDTSVGDIYSQLTDGLARNYRLSLGTSTVRGVSARLYDNDFDLRSGLGDRGYLAGGPYPGFEQSRGSLGWLGMTRQFAGGWSVAGQIDRASDIPASYVSIFSPTGIGARSVSSWATSVGYGPQLLGDKGIRLRATVLGSDARSNTGDTLDGRAQGIFLEGSARRGRYRHEGGIYRADPNLFFGDHALATGTRGAYWRVDRSGARLNWGAGLDYERSEPLIGGTFDGRVAAVRPSSTRMGLSTNAQYLIDRRSSVGASLNVFHTRSELNGAYGVAEDAPDKRQSAPGSRSLYGSTYWQTRLNDWGRTRFSGTVRRNESIVAGGSTATGEELQWEQDWITGRYETLRPEFVTTLGYARDRSDGITRTYPTAGVQFRHWFDPTLSAGGNLRYTSQNSGLYTSRGLSGSLSAEKSLGRGWHLGAIASLNQARSAYQQTSLFTPSLSRSDDKSFYVFLRWEGSAGRPHQAAGNATPEAGSGGVAGHVFFDENHDGLQQPGERGVPEVEVLLDGRYRTRTLADGSFEFPVVHTGRHQISLVLESVPLPWGASDSAVAPIDVPLRGRAETRIPVVRTGP